MLYGQTINLCSKAVVCLSWTVTVLNVNISLGHARIADLRIFSIAPPALGIARIAASSFVDI